MIVLLDESGLSQQPHRVRTWARQGQTPVLDQLPLEAFVGYRWDDVVELLFSFVPQTHPHRPRDRIPGAMEAAPAWPGSRSTAKTTTNARRMPVTRSPAVRTPRSRTAASACPQSPGWGTASSLPCCSERLCSDSGACRPGKRKSIPTDPVNRSIVCLTPPANRATSSRRRRANLTTVSTSWLHTLSSLHIVAGE